MRSFQQERCIFAAEKETMADLAPVIIKNG
jgi:hypothetical protein